MMIALPRKNSKLWKFADFPNPEDQSWVGASHYFISNVMAPLYVMRITVRNENFGANIC